MKQKIEEIINAIEQEKNSLVRNANAVFDSIVISTESVPQVQQQSKTPPISYILYGVGAVSLLTALTANTDSRLGSICVGGLIAGACVVGAKKFQNKPTAQKPTSTSSQSTSSIKSKIIDKSLTLISDSVNRWDNFMTQKKMEIQNAIQSSGMSDSQKESAMSKTYFYEIISYSLPDSLSFASSNSELAAQKIRCQQEFVNVIKTVADKQISIYKEVLNMA